MQLRAAVAMLVLACAAPAAATPGIAFIYQRAADAADCPDAHALQAAVAAQLGYDPFGDGPLGVTATIRHVDGKLTARLELWDENGAPIGTRELSAHDCGELAPTVEWVLAMAIDPLRERALAQPPEAAQADAQTQPHASRAPAELQPADEPDDDDDDDAKTATAPRRLPFGITVGAGMGAALTAAPGPALAFTLALAATGTHWSVGVEARGDLPASAPAAFSGSVQTALITALVVPCLRRKVASVCALAAFGAEWGQGTGYSEPKSVSSFYAAVGGRLAFDFPLTTTLALRFHADLLAPLTRMELYAGLIGDSSHKLYRTPDVSSLLALAILAHFE